MLTPQGIAVVQASEGAHSEFTCTDPVLRETGLVVEVDSPIFGPIVRAAPPVAFSETPGRAAPGCMVAQHTRAILTEIGYDVDQIDALVAASVVSVRD
jgi:crotonobetainyl-CoA:carnitine CoA-transferase CaiB-like acyl-CoA transferase